MGDWLMYRYTNQAAGQSPKPRLISGPDSSAKPWDFTTTDVLGRTISSSSTSATTPHPPPPSVPAAMELARGSISSNSTAQSNKEEPNLLLQSMPYVLKHGRRYLRDVPYPLPCDLPELQRQNLHTLLTTTVHGKPLCAPLAGQQPPPKKILEVACGTGYWSSLCHEWFASRGHSDISFTGVDVVPLAGDLRNQGINWRFCQHDLRKVPLPFDDGEFDVVMVRDIGIVLQTGPQGQRLLDEAIRVLRKGGVLEVWETDTIIRTMLPHQGLPPGRSSEAYACALATGTSLIIPGTPFTVAQNKYLQDANNWVQEAFDKRRINASPCARVAEVLLQEPDDLCDIGYRRVAIPLGEPRWEREGMHERDPSKRRESEPSRSRGNRDDGSLTEDQSAIRYTALMVVLQMIESLEPLLKDVSGKNQEEWHRWWGSMMTDLLENNGASGGECLEIGAWWATKTEA